MKSEHISIKKMAIPFLSLAIASQAAGCGSTNQDDIPDLDNQSQLTQQEIADLDIDWGEGPYPILKYDWDYETDWKEILKLSNDDYQLELQYCEEKCPKEVMLASYIDGYFEWKDEYVANQVRPEVNNNPSSEKPKQEQVNTQAQTSKPAPQQSSKPQTETSKPSGSGSSGAMDIQPIRPSDITVVHEECNPDGTTPGKLEDANSTGDISHITVE